LLAQERDKLENQTRYFRLHSMHLVGGLQKVLEHAAARIDLVSTSHLRQEQQRLNNITGNLEAVTSLHLKDMRSNLQAIEKTVHLLDPLHVLQRGYSITRLNGAALKSTDTVKAGDVIEDRKSVV